MVLPDGGIALRLPRPREEAEVRVVSVLISDIGVEWILEISETA